MPDPIVSIEIQNQVPEQRRMFNMTPLRAKGAPFTCIQTEEYMIHYGKMDQRRAWISDGFSRIVINRHGDAVQLLRDGVNADEFIDEMNRVAAFFIMAEDTAAAQALKSYSLSKEL